MNIEQLVERELAVETEILGENLLQCHFIRHKSHMPDLRSNPGRSGWKPPISKIKTSPVKINRLLSFDMTRLHIKGSVQPLFYYWVCIRRRYNIFTEPLPSNDRGIHM
jgi:hypothetical protein